MLLKEYALSWKVKHNITLVFLLSNFTQVLKIFYD